MKLIVGLGNPGEKYTLTRHNAGFAVLNELAVRLDLNWKLDKKLQAEVAETNLNDEKLILLKPQTFMNLSGQAVAAAANKFKIETGDVWVVYDEAALPFGVLRTRLEGSAGGHNGLKSIIEHLGADFVRFRFGIGKAPEKMALEDWVLSKFNVDEKKLLEKLKTDVVDRILAALENGIESETENLTE